jgi:hypothetical protein
MDGSATAMEDLKGLYGERLGRAAMNRLGWAAMEVYHDFFYLQ